MRFDCGGRGLVRRRKELVSLRGVLDELAASPRYVPGQRYVQSELVQILRG